MLDFIVITILVFATLYYRGRLIAQQQFTRFLENENWSQRQIVNKAKLQANDVNLFLTQFQDKACLNDEDKEANKIRTKMKANIMAENSKLISSIENLDKE